MRVCPDCKSPWVSWNWIKISGNESLNPNTSWLHECQNCSNSFLTTGSVDDGIPYKILREIGYMFVEPGLFDRNMAAEHNEELESAELDEV